MNEKIAQRSHPWKLLHFRRNRVKITQSPNLSSSNPLPNREKERVVLRASGSSPFPKKMEINISLPS